MNDKGFHSFGLDEIVGLESKKADNGSGFVIGPGPTE